MAASVIDIVTEIFEQEELDCVVIEEGVAVKTAMTADDELGWTCHVEIAPLSDEISALVVFCRPFESLDEAYLLPTLKLINRINANLMAVGSFEVDMDHDLTLRTGLVFGAPEELTSESIAHTLFMNWAEMQRYLPAILEVAQGSDMEGVWGSLID